MLVKSFEPYLTPETEGVIKEVLESKVLGFGPNVKLFEERFQERSQKEFNVGFNSASSAALAVFSYLQETKGPCDVYTPTIGFISPVWAAKFYNHNIHFVDVNNNALFNFAHYLELRQQNNSERLKVVMPVLYGGVSCLEKESWVGDEVIVVDSAHCINPQIKCDFSFFSFHPVKPICMANGGLLATDDSHAYEYFMKYRNFGREFSGHTYNVVQDGGNFYLNNLNAAIGLEQLNVCDHSIHRRRSNFNYMKTFLNLKLGHLTDHGHNSSYYLATLILKAANTGYIQGYLADYNIQASLHYPLLHKMKIFNCDEKLPNAEQLVTRLINIPIHQNLELKDLEHIIERLNYYANESNS
jgi:dTDP-4-amino-4,6-dideoxygalactose transaminase